MRRAAAAVLAILVLAWIPLPMSTPARAATTVSGTIPADTTWNLSGSPYLVVGEVLVPAGVTLTVEPGVQVRFDTTPPASLSIRIQGTLRSVGVPGTHVTFTSDDPFPDRNDWVSIAFEGSVGSVVEYTTLMWGSITLDVRQSSPRIANNSILESGLRAIQVIGPDANPIIEDNVIATQLFNERVGIIVQGADPVIRNNRLLDNYFGIYVDFGGRPRIEGNEILNGWRGVLVVSADPVLVSNRIEGNGLPNLGGVGIILFDSAATLVNNTIRDNGVGVDIPYNSARTLGLSSGNTVNGAPLERMYHYRERDTVLLAPILDSGHTSGYTGNATQQGLLTFYDCVNVTVANARLRNNEVLFLATNSSVTLANATFGNASRDLLLSGISQVVSLNSTFRTGAVNFTDDLSSLTVKNFLHIRTVTEGGSPLASAGVRVLQDGVEVAYRSTGPDGWTRWIVAAHGVLSGRQSPTLTLSVVRAQAIRPGITFLDNPRTVDMSRSRTEVFAQSDATPPRVLETVPGNNSVGVAFGSRVTITFSEPMNRTATEAAIRVLGTAPADFEWSADGTSVSFRIADVRHGATYFVEVGDAATDLSGNAIADAHLFTFDIEQAPRRVDFTALWVTSIVVLAIGLAAVAVRRLRSRPETLGEEEGGDQE